MPVNPNMINNLFQVMRMRGINIPQGVNMNDPNAILQYLMQNGKITQDQYNIAYQQYRSMYPQGNNNSRQLFPVKSWFQYLLRIIKAGLKNSYKIIQNGY